MEEEEGRLIVSPQPAVDRERLLKMVLPLKWALEAENKKNQALVADREHLLQVMELRSEQYASRLGLLEWQIGQMKVEKVKMQKANNTQLEFLLANNDRQALSCKTNAGLAEKDLEEVHTRIDALNGEMKTLKSKLKNKEPLQPTGACDNTEVKDLQLEVRKLKNKNKTLKSEKESQVKQKENQIEALVAEKDFVWNQLNVMESEHVAAIKSKNSELEKSNEAIEMLKKNIEEMEASLVEKDSIISKKEDEISEIKDEMAASISEKDATICQLEKKFQASISKKDDMISRQNGEIEKLKKMMKEKDLMISSLHADVAKFAARVGPVCKPMDSGTGQTLRTGAKRARESASWAPPSASQSVSGRRQHSNRSQGSGAISTAEKANLFSASFKVPKLKTTATKFGTPSNALPR